MARVPHIAGVATPRRFAERISGTPGYLLYALTFVAIMLSGLAYLSGSPPYLAVAILMVGIASFLIGRRSRNDAEKVVRALDGEAASRAEIETLADRMWELQESEERFRGLIDALGDIVVHRDRPAISSMPIAYWPTLSVARRRRCPARPSPNSASRSAWCPTPPSPKASA